MSRFGREWKRLVTGPVPCQRPAMSNRDEIEAAAARLHHHVRRTPILPLDHTELAADVTLKLPGSAGSHVAVQRSDKPLNIISSVGSWILALSILMFFWNVYIT